MADWLDWTGEPGPWQSNEAPGIDWSAFTQGGPGSWGGQQTTDFANGGGGKGNSLMSILASLGPAALKSLGPLLQAGGSLAAGQIGSNAAQDASRLQAQALNRGIDLQTAQWLQSQAQQAPWMEAGKNALGELTWRQGVETSPDLPGATAAISGANYAMPSTTPGWQPQAYQGPQGPNAADYRWTPGQGPQAADYRYTPGAVPTLSGQELLANDPGYQFRQDEARKALEGSAAARGDLLSGGNLKALQSRSQDLASQEYGQAWNRASQQAQLREQWNQYATAQGWSQAQAEAAFREQMAQQSSQQGWNQALAGQQNQFTQGLEAQKWNQGQQQSYETDLYNRMMEQSKLQYGRDVYSNETDYSRQQQMYNQRIAEMTRQWNQAAGLAGVGQTATGQVGQQGQAAQTNLSSLLSQLATTQGQGAAASGLINSRTASGLANQVPSLLASLNR